MLEPGVGGRIFEQTPSGTVLDWGVVTEWDPPHELSYLWHLGREQSDATAVQITFSANGERETLVEIRHRGWEQLGTTAERWRDRNQIGWHTLLPHFTAAVKRGGS